MTYAPEQFRKVLKAEQHDYIQRAIDRARTAPAAYEGSLHPTGRTEFVVRSMNEALEKFAKLSLEGWTLDTSVLNLCVAPDVPLTFVAIKPDHVFEADIALIAQQAEKAYLKEIEIHNKEAQRLKEKAAFIEAEFNRLEEERKANLRAELERQFDSRGHHRVQHVISHGAHTQ
ncbi:hypothetical protein [Pseudomonas guariconensis]|uniref:hypothetical protein n=1 Tax=Pseudomonas guariconensis TaxID=1288410 RepID=UPI0018AABD2A|nr:hypothetical protein [Pseudomonas guariconensis]MBF8740229.1 hypothetical protein [Pseudomonas guariconensis]MBF8750372.1 hypothetical protein [Pseudomonas guariconensis]